MIEKVDTSEAIAELGRTAITAAKENGIDVKEDTFTVIQPYNNGQAITFRVDEDDETNERTINVTVNDTTIVLEPKDELLDIFITGGEDQ